MVARKYDTQSFIIAIESVHGKGTFSFTDTIFLNMKKNVTLKCNDCGRSVDRTPNELIKKKYGCRFCDGRLFTTETFIIRSKKIHGEGAYCYINTIYTGMDNEVILFCNKCQKEFKQRAGNHVIDGSGCQECGKRKSSDSQKMSIETFIVRSKKIHGNNTFDYSLTISNGYQNDIILKCKKHNYIFNLSINNHLKGQGCPRCSGTLILTEDFIERAKKKHGNKYEYPLGITEFNGTGNKIDILCNKHNIFTQIAFVHLQGHGCPDCGGHKQKNTDSFIEAAEKKHGIGTYGYSYVDYKDTKTEILIECFKCNIIFSQKPWSHLRGYGCKNCSQSKYKMETEWLDTLQVPKDLRQKRIKIGKRRIVADAYDPATNTIYEFFGNFWHGHPDFYNSDKVNPRSNRNYGNLYQETLAKIADIESAGYNLIHIWESDWLAQKKEMAKNAEK